MKHALLTLLLLFSGLARAQLPLPAMEDRIRLAEAFRLADSVQDAVWEGWSQVPFTVLLVTPDHEYLLRHPFPPGDFVSLGRDEVTGEEIHARTNSGSYALDFLATFPAIRGVNTVVVGQPGNTGKTSTSWVVTLLHEHFHQLQYTRPWYYESVKALDLAGGDQTGMWQLNYLFPYDSDEVAAAVDAYRRSLLDSLSMQPDAFEAVLESLLSSRETLRAALEPADYRYLSFQLWQEGVARYTEHAVASAAVRLHRPSADFRALDDFSSYTEVLEELDRKLETELETMELADWRRVVFYPLGAAEALLLDAVKPGWKEAYFSRPLDLENALGPAGSP